MNNINKTYRRDKNHNYLILSLSEEEEESQYQIEMIRENNIDGLLPCDVVSVDGRHEYRYEITSRQQMDRIFEKKDLTGYDIGQFLEGFKTVLSEMEKYLLDADALIIRPEYIYMDVEKKIPAFCCLPCYKGSFKEEFRDFAQYLLKKLDHRDVSAVSMGYNIYRVTLDENYDMAAVFNLKYQQESEYTEQKMAAGREQYDKGAESLAEKTPDEYPVSTELDFEQEYKDGSGSINGENNKKGVRHRKIKARKHIRNRSSSPEKIQESDLNKGHGNGDFGRQEKEKGFRLYKVLIVLAGTGVTGGLLFAAAWFGELNLTQLGGLLFLILGLLIYFTSVWTGPQKKEKKKEYTENAGYELMMEYEGAEEAKAGSSRKGEQEYARLRNRPSADKSGGISESRKNSGNVKDDIFEEYTEYQKTGSEEFFGETVLLNGKGSEELSYCLIPQNTEDRHEIWLDQKSMTIGKLGQQVDILVDHPSVSRVHARLIREGENYSLIDMNSTNGTYLNGQRLSPDEICPLKDGDEIRFAVRSFLVERRTI